LGGLVKEKLLLNWRRLE